MLSSHTKASSKYLGEVLATLDVLAALGEWLLGSKAALPGYGVLCLNSEWSQGLAPSHFQGKAPHTQYLP